MVGLANTNIYSTDPNKIKKAKKIKEISYEEMLEMASLGAKVMQPASIQDARLNRINVEVKSSFIIKPSSSNFCCIYNRLGK